MQTLQPQKQKEEKVPKRSQEENVLVVKRETLFPNGAVSGLQRVDLGVYEQLIMDNTEFLPRSQAEVDSGYKQIIPYLVFTYKNKYFLMQRKDTASEKRLKNKYSLGIGGHIRQEDITGKGIFDWATREFSEEINYEGSFEIEPVGLINDENNFVGKVHTGFVFLLKGDSDKISIRDEHAHGVLLTKEECTTFYPQMESWSKLVFDFLRMS